MKKLASLMAAGFALPALVSTALAQDYVPFEHHHAMGEGWGGGWGGMLFGPLMMIVFLAAVVILVVVAVRWTAGASHAGGHPGRMSPLDMLKDRFARGEIDKQEYEERRRVLSD
jgi:putative membrane protein